MAAASVVIIGLSSVFDRVSVFEFSFREEPADTKLIPDTDNTGADKDSSK